MDRVVRALDKKGAFKKGARMKIANQLAIEIEKGEHTFVFYIPHGASWGHTLDAAYDVLKEIGNLSHRAIEQQKPAQSKENDANQ